MWWKQIGPTKCHCHRRKSFYAYFLLQLTATQRIKTDVVPLVGSDCFSRSETKASIFCIFYWSFVGWTNVWPLPKLKKCHMWSSRAFILENGQHSEICMFNTVRFGARNITHRPRKALFLGWDKLGSLCLRGISPTLNITGTNPENFNFKFLVKYPEYMISKFSVEPFWMDDPKVLFTKGKFWTIARVFFRFWQLALRVTVGHAARIWWDNGAHPVVRHFFSPSLFFHSTWTV